MDVDTGLSFFLPMVTAVLVQYWYSMVGILLLLLVPLNRAKEIIGRRKVTAVLVLYWLYVPD